MYSSFELAVKYLGYYIKASNGKGHGTHSPFIFNFITAVLNDKTNYAEFELVEGLRRELLMDSRTLEIEDFGAGSTKGSNSSRTIASLAKYAAKPRKYGQLLYRLAHHYSPATILELGTSLGLTSAYLALAQPNARVITLEGANAVADIAASNFQQLAIKNIEQVRGNFAETLSPVFLRNPSIDLAFIDGNHREEPTIDYFNQLLPHTHNDSILVFDDIHWSAGMEKAWATIRAHESVRCSIDLFFIGILFFRKEFKEKQDFTIRF